MARLAQTAGLTEIQQEILSTVRTFVDKEIIPHAHGAGARRRLPAGHRRRDEGDGPVRAHHPGGVRRARRVAADLRAGRRADRARLDERLRRDQHPLHRGVHDHPPRHRRAEAALPAADGRGRRAARSRCPSRTSARDVAAIKTRAVRGRRRVRDRRRQDVADQRRHLQPDRGAGQDRRGRAEAAPEPHLLPGGEAGRLRRGRARAGHPREDRQDGLQGRRHHRDGVQGLPGRRRADPGRQARRRVRPDDGRRRGRPGERRRAGVRDLDPGLRAGRRSTPSSARRSASRSPSTRPSRSSWPRWPPRSRPRT